MYSNGDKLIISLSHDSMKKIKAATTCRYKYQLFIWLGIFYQAIGRIA
jgi:hypothetical protein